MRPALRHPVAAIFALLTTLPAIAEEIAAPRVFQLAVAAGFNRILSGDDFVKQNAGAEFGIIATMPFKIWREDANLITLRAQYTRYTDDLVLPNSAKIFYPSHSQVKADLRQIFRQWSIDWSFGLGFQIPVYNRALTPLGTFNFDDTVNLYPDARQTLAKIDRSYALYLRAGIDQKFFDDALIAGLGLEFNLIEIPKTQQRATLNFYIGARLW